MANVLIEESILQGWADTVREKTGSSDKMLPSVLLSQTKTNWGTGGGSSDGGSAGIGQVDGVPYIVQAATITKNKVDLTTSQTVTKSIPKGATIVAVYAVYRRLSDATAYPMVDNLKVLDPSEYTVNRNYNDSYDQVSYTFAGMSWSGTAWNTFVLLVQYVAQGITLSPRSDGLFDAVLTNSEQFNRDYSGAFLNLKSTQMLKSLSVATGVTSIPKYMFQGNYHPLLESVDLTGVTSIGNDAFSGCANLNSITFDPNAASISLGDRCFYECSALTGTFTIPKNITSIPTEAFIYNNFSKIIFHEGITEIGNNAFSPENRAISVEYDFSACTSVPTALSNWPLGSPNNGVDKRNMVLKIPSALLEEWSTADYWSIYADFMVAV